MQFCKVEIKLGGDMLNTVVKSGVSVPEIALLRAIHGSVDSVVVLGIEDVKTVSSASELDRLRREYDVARNDKGDRVIDVVFPGVGIKLATKLSDIGDPFVSGEPVEDESADESADEISEDSDKKSKRVK